MWVKEKGSITNAEYQRIAQISRETAKRDLSRLVKLGVLVRKGAGRKVVYEMGQTGQKRVRNGSPGRGDGDGEAGKSR